MSTNLYRYVYKITNKVNGKAYIGKHTTKHLPNKYMGSGALVKDAIRKYGLDNFQKDILVFCATEKEVAVREKELIQEHGTLAPVGYNLQEGGTGGFSYINNSEEQTAKRKEAARIGLKRKLEKMSPEEYKEYCTKYYKNRKRKPSVLKRRKHSEETKRKIGTANSLNVGDRNSQYGTKWAINSITKELLKLKKEAPLPTGYIAGRVVREPKRFICLKCNTTFFKESLIPSKYCSKECKGLAISSAKKLAQIGVKKLRCVQTGKNLGTFKECVAYYGRTRETIRLWLKAGKLEEIK